MEYYHQRPVRDLSASRFYGRDPRSVKDRKPETMPVGEVLPPQGGGEEDLDCRGNARPSLAMVYAPVQRFRDLYEPDDALTHGTVFTELDKPFCGRVIGGEN